MLIDEKPGSRRTMAAELALGVAIIITVAIGVYQVQHPHVTHAQQIQAAMRP